MARNVPVNRRQAMSRRRKRSWTLFCHTVPWNSDADNNVQLTGALPEPSGESFMHRWKVGLAPAKPAYRKRRRRALVADRLARRRERSIAAGLSRSQRSARTATVSLNIGPALIVVLLLSVALWATLCAVIALALA
jgi:hypothetical protein